MKSSELKKILKLNFPGIKFSVKTHSYNQRLLISWKVELGTTATYDNVWEVVKNQGLYSEDFSLYCERDSHYLLFCANAVIANSGYPELKYDVCGFWGCDQTVNNWAYQKFNYYMDNGVSCHWFPGIEKQEQVRLVTA